MTHATARLICSLSRTRRLLLRSTSPIPPSLEPPDEPPSVRHPQSPARSPARRLSRDDDRRPSFDTRRTGAAARAGASRAALRPRRYERRSDKNQPSAETGELGFQDGYDRSFLTITTGFGARVFELLGVPADQRPQDLQPIPWDALHDTPDKSDNGDVLLQVCSDNAYINEHVLRRVQEELADTFTVAWVVQGHQRYNSRQGRVSRTEGRALIGFLDGTSNLNPGRSEDDAGLIFVDPARVGEYPLLPQPGQPNPYGGPQPPQFPGDLRPAPTHEPEWALNGTYCVVRASTIDTPRWDRETLDTQEHVVGRFKFSGASLDLADDDAQLHADPAFATNPADERVPIGAHVRKANPRTSADLAHRIFRRGYPLIESAVDELRRGLVFICFARTISTQFEFITRAWTTNPDFPRPGAGIDPLRAYEHVLCGGYFFVPPISSTSKPWSWVLPETAV
ncbi:MAG TPA: Dyp-type peroxidase [Conexibacter sp.]|nr:Dyp-type peroxidase [Conexibacter sp.]